MTTRRSFIGSIAAICGAAGVPAATLAAIEQRELSGGTDAIGILVQCIHIYGAESTAAAILASSGPVDAIDIRRQLRRIARRQRRADSAAERRERHANDEVLYRGPVQLDQVFTGRDGREVRSANRRRVLVGSTDREYVLSGIWLPLERHQRRVVDIDVARDGSLDRHIDVVETRAISLPRGSRVLIDLRHGIRHVMACEVIRTAHGQMRMHLWTGRTGTSDDMDTVPRLHGGVVYESRTERVIGLLGLPV